jgi:hypothetical protein
MGWPNAATGVCYARPPHRIGRHIGFAIKQLLFTFFLQKMYDASIAGYGGHF